MDKWAELGKMLDGCTICFCTLCNHHKEYGYCYACNCHNHCEEPPRQGIGKLVDTVEYLQAMIKIVCAAKPSERDAALEEAVKLAEAVLSKKNPIHIKALAREFMRLAGLEKAE